MLESMGSQRVGYNSETKQQQKIHTTIYKMGFPGGSVAKNSLAKQEMWVQSLGGEDSLKKEVATHSSILAWEIPWPEDPGGLQSMGLEKSQILLSN